MISELEQEFYNTFGIEKKCNRETLKFCVGDLDCNTCKSPFYPKITAEKLLKMIIIRATNYKNGTVIELEPDSNIEDLKYEVLRHFIDYRGNFDKYQIQQLFKD